MVFDTERGCVHGDSHEEIAPRETPVSLAIDTHRAMWSQAIAKTQRAELPSALERIYSSANGRTIKEFPKKDHPVFPGFTPYGFGEDELLAYRCGYERVIQAGSPEIVESSINGHINFNCRSCKGTMYSEEVQPNLRVC